MKFSNCKMELWEYLEDSTNLNDYGEPVKSYDLYDVVPCNFQNADASETSKEYGDIQTNAYKAYFDVDVKVNESMVLRVVGETDTYEIIGKPMKYDHFTVLSHIKVLLQRHQEPIHLHKAESKRRLSVNTKNPS